MGEDSSKAEPPAANLERKESANAQSGSIRSVLITSGFTLLGIVLGALVTGYFNLRTENTKESTELQIEQQKALKEIELEHQKFDADLVKMAIQARAVGDRIDFLRFMVSTNLISDPQIRKGVLEYLPRTSQEEAKIVPRFQSLPANPAGSLTIPGSTPEITPTPTPTATPTPMPTTTAEPEASASPRPTLGPSPLPDIAASRSPTSVEKVRDAVQIATDLWKGNYEAVRLKFDDWMLRNLTVPAMKEATEKLVSPLGHLINATGRPSFKDETLFVNVLCTADNGLVTVQVWYDQAGKVAGLWLVPRQVSND
jgi:hypothetical protein